MRRTIGLRPLLAQALAAAVLAGVEDQKVRADGVIVTTEAMIVDIEANTVLFVTRLGVDLGVGGATPLSFVSFVDPSGASFRYSTAPGSTYLGMPFSLSAQGTLVAPGVFQTSATGSFGGEGFGTDGDLLFFDMDGNQLFWSDVDTKDDKGKKTGDYHSEIKVKDMKSSGKGYLTDALGNPIPKTDLTIKDSYDTNTKKWNSDITPDFPETYEPPPVRIFHSGTTPPEGGDGTFTMSLASIPEPSVMALALVGALAASAYTLFARRLPQGARGEPR